MFPVPLGVPVHYDVEELGSRDQNLPLFKLSHDSGPDRSTAETFRWLRTFVFVIRCINHIGPATDAPGTERPSSEAQHYFLMTRQRKNEDLLPLPHTTASLVGHIKNFTVLFVFEYIYIYIHTHTFIYIFFFFFKARQPLMGQGILTVEALRSQTHHSR